MIDIILNGEPSRLAQPISIQQLIEQIGLDPRKVAVEINREVVPKEKHPERRLQPGDAVEIVTLVGGGSHEFEEQTTDLISPVDKRLKVGKFSFHSRLITGTGKYAGYQLMRDCLEASGCEVTTVAVRRERLIDKEGKSILDFLDLKKLTILPNTAGCFNAEDAIRHARIARELLTNLGNPGADWVKLECLADPKTLLPDPVATLQATETLVKEGFQVLVYTSDDPVMAKRLKNAGAASVMPAGSPIGSGQGVLNPNNIRIILEYLKEGDRDYPVIIDAGVGTASDVAIAMELGCDGVLLNTGIASAQDPLRMAYAMKYACDAGRLAYLAGRIPKKLYATASSPMEGRIGTK
jgi:thiazole synthase